ncbi:MAG: hypothetical protein ACP5F1_05580 [Thermoplasmata archaeon]
MINPIDLISEMERNAKNLIKKGRNMEAKKILENALESIKNEDFLENEYPDLVIISKKIFSDFLSISEYSLALEVLININKVTGEKFNLTNELKNLLKILPVEFDLSKYDKEIRKLSRNQWEILELLNEIEKMQKRGSD